jgi:hypothetical protein
MNKCERCDCCFKSTWNLEQHKKRKVPCKEKNSSFDSSAFLPQTQFQENFFDNIDQDAVLNNPEILINHINNNSDIYKGKCKWCLHEDKSHEDTCKLKNDPIRTLEIEKGVQVTLPDSNTQCRFCNKSFLKLNRHLSTCKELQKYKLQLQSQPNVTTNVKNNIIINLDGGGIDLLKIINLMDKLSIKFGDENVYLKIKDVMISYKEFLCK